MLTDHLTGADLSYWVARSNTKGSRQESLVLRRHYGLQPHNDPSVEPHMRNFVADKFGAVLPPCEQWQ